MTARSYSDLSDSATTFDPEEQFDRDIDERMKGMTAQRPANADMVEGSVTATTGMRRNRPLIDRLPTVMASWSAGSTRRPNYGGNVQRKSFAVWLMRPWKLMMLVRREWDEQGRDAFFRVSRLRQGLRR
jgi:hypothetical protein